MSSKSPPQPAQTGLGQKLKDSAVPMIIAVVQTALVAWFGFQITGKLDLAIKQRQIALESAGKMAALIETMQSDSVKDDVRRATALRLAMYGEEAIPPLIFMAAAPAPYSEEIPLGGLLLISILHKPLVCEALRRAVGSKQSIDQARFQGMEKVLKDLTC